MLPDRDFMVRATRARLATGGRATASARTCRRVVARRTRGRSAKPAIRGQEETTSRSVVGGVDWDRVVGAGTRRPLGAGRLGPKRPRPRAAECLSPMWLRAAI